MTRAHIERILKATPSAHTQIQSLLSQLYPDQPPLSFEKFKRIVEGSHIRVYTAILEGKIVGTAQLMSYEKLGGDAWIIEDVVVDETVRGKGIGQLLTEYTLNEAKAAGAKSVDLSTRREEAKNFYIEKCGFKDKAESRPFWGLRYTF